MFTIKDCSVRIKGNSYEVRFQKFGYSKSFCNKSLEEAQQRMKKYLKEISNTLHPKAKKGHSFDEWLNIYLNSYKKIQLSEKSFANLVRVINLHILPLFTKRDITDIKTLEIQNFLVKLIESGKGRTAEECKVILNGYFETAKQNKLLLDNPMQGVAIPKHYRKHGTALTLEEEKAFLKNVDSVAYFKKALLFLLYSGARISEVVKITESDINLERNTLLIHTTKCKDNVNGNDRVIPIFPKLANVIKMPGKLKVDKTNISQAFKKICPEHHLHELRHTFTTRCRENGIDNELTSLWTGHTFAGNTTSVVYTHFSYEFQQEQAKKLDY